MKELLPRHLRLILLIVGTTILAVEAFFHYQYLWAAPTPTRLPVTVTSPEPQITLPTSEPLDPNRISRVVSFEPVKTIDQAGIDAAELSFMEVTQDSLVTEVQVYKLTYEILGKDNKWQPVTATVYIPVSSGVEPPPNYPMYVFGSGTTGMADKCAPSLENMKIENLGNYENHMISQAAAGFVSVFPDYEGFHSPETQAYFIVESEAKVLLGAILSLHELQPTTPSLSTTNFTQIFLAGYSQGGHAALSAARNWELLPSEIVLRGVIQYAGAADVLALFQESPWLASYLVDSFTQYYGEALDPSLVLQQKWLQEMAQNNQILCVNQAYRYYPHDQMQIYTTSFVDALASPTWPASLQNWQKAIALNSPLDNLPNVPYLSIQGATDPIVTARTQVKNVQVMCADGHDVVYRELPGVNHFRVRQESLTYSTLWMREVLEGQPIASSCNLQL